MKALLSLTAATRRRSISLTRFEVSPRGKARYRLNSPPPEANALYGIEDLIGTFNGDLNETDSCQNLNSADNGPGHTCFICNTSDEITRCHTRVITDVELNPDSRFVNSWSLIL